MSKPLILGGIVTFLIILSEVALSFGITTDVITPPSPLSTPGGSFLDGFFTAFRYMFDAVASIFQILTFQVQIHPLANLLLFIPIAFMLFYMGLSLVRGGD